jgi:hypothetical protein
LLAISGLNPEQQELLRHSGGELPWDDAAVLVVGIR